MTKRIALFILIVSVTALSAAGQASIKRHFITRDEAIDMVIRLPEVKESNRYILTHSKDKRKLFAMIYGEPTRKNPYWWVAVGEDNGMCFVTHYGFLVYIKSGKIFYVDTLNGTHI